MAIIIIQAGTLKELVSTNDATIVGVLLAFIALLIYWNIRTDNKLVEANKYTRDQDKANLIMMQDLISAMNVVGGTSEKNAIKIDGVNSKTEAILTIIKERLNVNT